MDMAPGSWNYVAEDGDTAALLEFIWASSRVFQPSRSCYFEMIPANSGGSCVTPSSGSIGTALESPRRYLPTVWGGHGLP